MLTLALVQLEYDKHSRIMQQRVARHYTTTLTSPPRLAPRPDDKERRVGFDNCFRATQRDDGRQLKCCTRRFFLANQLLQSAPLPLTERRSGGEQHETEADGHRSRLSRLSTWRESSGMSAKRECARFKPRGCRRPAGTRANDLLLTRIHGRRQANTMYVDVRRCRLMTPSLRVACGEWAM